jgi:hypothetical protein
MAAPLAPSQIPVAQDLRVALFEERLGLSFTSDYNAYWSLREGRAVTLAEGARLDADYRAGRIAPPDFNPQAPVLPAGSEVVRTDMLTIPAPSVNPVFLGSAVPAAVVATSTTREATTREAVARFAQVVGTLDAPGTRSAMTPWLWLAAAGLAAWWLLGK